MKGRYVGQLTQEAGSRFGFLGGSLTVIVQEEAGPGQLFMLARDAGPLWTPVSLSDFEGKVLMPLPAVLRALAHAVNQ